MTSQLTGCKRQLIVLVARKRPAAVGSPRLLVVAHDGECPFGLPDGLAPPAPELAGNSFFCSQCVRLCGVPAPPPPLTRDFWLVWTTNTPLPSWRLAVLCSIAHHHPGAIVHLLAVYPEAIDVRRLTAYGYRVLVQRLDPVAFFRDTPMAEWATHFSEYEAAHPFFFTHFSDAFRIVALAKFGGVYSDVDAVALAPYDDVRNGIAEAPPNPEKIIYNPALMLFEMGHPALRYAAQLYPSRYNPSCWGCVGPLLFTHVVEALTSLSLATPTLAHPPRPNTAIQGVVQRYQHEVFFPMHWKQSLAEHWLPSADALQQLHDLPKNTISFHIFSGLWHKKIPDLIPGTYFGTVLGHNCPIIGDLWDVKTEGEAS